MEDQGRAAGDEINAAPPNLAHVPLYPVALMFEDCLMQGKVLLALFSITHFIFGTICFIASCF